MGMFDVPKRKENFYWRGLNQTRKQIWKKKISYEKSALGEGEGGWGRGKPLSR